MATTRDLGSLASLPIEIDGVLDERRMTMRELLSLRPGSLVKLQRSAGEYVDVIAGGALLGFGEVVVIENVIGIRMTVFHSQQ